MDFEYIVITLNRGYNTYDTYVMDARDGFTRQISFYSDNTEAANGAFWALKFTGRVVDQVWLDVEEDDN
jgi:hypothetical protein